MDTAVMNTAIINTVVNTVMTTIMVSVMVSVIDSHLIVIAVVLNSLVLPVLIENGVIRGSERMEKSNTSTLASIPTIPLDIIRVGQLTC